MTDDTLLAERTIEKRVSTYARAIGYFEAKFRSVNQRSVPDKLFINPHGLTIYIEFKKAGLIATPAQARKHKQMHTLVFVVDNIPDGKKILDTWVDYDIGIR